MEKPSTSKIIDCLLFGWGSAGGFVVGAALAALVLRRLGAWPPSERYLKRFAVAKAQTKSEDNQHVGQI